MIFEGELDAHLNYEKHKKTKEGNPLNGYIKKNVRASSGEWQITVPRDRNASFNPMNVPKRGNMIDGIENVHQGHEQCRYRIADTRSV